MSTWTRELPWLGDSQMISSGAALISERLNEFGAVLVTLRNNALLDWSSAAAQVIHDRVAEVLLSAEQLHRNTESLAYALSHYATELEDIHRIWTTLEARAAQLDEVRLRRQGLELRSGLSFTTFVEDAMREVTFEQTTLERARQDLVDRRHQIDGAFAATLSSASVLGTFATTGFGGADLSAVVSRLTGVIGSRFSSTERSQISDTEGLQTLITISAMNPLDREALAELRPEILQNLVTHPPGAELVARWWSELDEGTQSSLIATMPLLVGGLGGVGFVARDRANRLNLTNALGSAKRELRDLRSRLKPKLLEVRSIMHGSVPRSPEVAESKGRAKLVDTAARKVKALQRLQETLRSAPVSADSPSTQLVSFTDADNPLAAVSIGNLDLARSSTVLVPGMNTDLSDISQWSRAARNVFTEAASLDPDCPRSVVAWIGYEAPRLGDFGAQNVLADESAQIGAEALRRDIRALNAVHATVDAGMARGGSDLNSNAERTLNIVGHSYGSTTGALAVSRSPGSTGLGVDTLITLGSAGLTVPRASDLDVGVVYAGEAELDVVADLGRIGSARHDPASYQFGAKHIGTDYGIGIGGRMLTGHDAVGGGTFPGYLDPGTNSLTNVARIITGNEDKITGDVPTIAW